MKVWSAKIFDSQSHLKYKKSRSLYRLRVPGMTTCRPPINAQLTLPNFLPIYLTHEILATFKVIQLIHFLMKMKSDCSYRFTDENTTIVGIKNSQKDFNFNKNCTKLAFFIDISQTMLNFKVFDPEDCSVYICESVGKIRFHFHEKMNDLNRFIDFEIAWNP